MTLAELQQNMRDWLETGEPDRAARFDVQSQSGLAVYLNNYRSQLLDCLEAAFPHTMAYLGATEFRQAARRHIMGRAPDAWTLADYPATFADGIADWFPNDPVAPELAALELALGDAVIAADRPPLTRAIIAELDWTKVALTHASGGKILQHYTNAGAIWSALFRGNAPPKAEQAECASSVLVWRSDWVPCFRTLETDEAMIFAEFAEPVPFTTICGLLHQKLGEQAAAGRAGQLLARWAEDEAVSVADVHNA
jgi:hypothetical protein